MLSCYILDDENAAIEVLSQYVSDTPALTLAGASTKPLEAAAFLKARPVDLLLLDIEMPRLPGPQFMELYGSHAAGVIFTTAYSQYALEGYERGVIDYLLKPIPYDRFLKAVEKATRQLRPAMETPAPAASGKTPEEDFIFVKLERKGKYQKVNLADIVYVEGLKNYVSLHTRQGERIVTYIGMGELEEKLPADRFIRVHRSYLVALDAIRGIEGNEILLHDAPRIPAAGQYRDAFFRRMASKFIQGNP